jgi:hypothetical protein
VKAISSLGVRSPWFLAIKIDFEVRFRHHLVIQQVWSMQFLWSVQSWFKGGPIFSDFLEMPTLKLRHYEKAAKFETIFHLF